MAIRTLYLPSVPLYLKLDPFRLCHQTQGISDTTPTLCMTSQTIHVTSYSVCMVLENAEEPEIKLSSKLPYHIQLSCLLSLFGL